MDVEIRPEPSETERRAILAALDGGDPIPDAYTSRWRESALDDLRGGYASAEDPGRDPGVVET